LILRSMPPYKMLFDLPSYGYDVYTRVRLAMLKRLSHAAW